MNPFIYTGNSNKQASLIIGKIRNLITTLQNANKSFKRIAARCTDRKAQIMVFGMATESFQFYKELSLYAQVLKGQPEFNENIFTDYCCSENAPDQEYLENFDQVLEDCVHIEKSLISEYRKLLNDHLITGDLRKLLQEQLNGFLYAFVKIKMLSNLHVKQSTTINFF